jgi:hemolysin III
MRAGTATRTTQQDSVRADGSLYDALRDVYYAKPRLRGWLHLVWFELSLVVGTLVIVAADGALEVTAITIYAATVSGLFGISALYHRGTYSARVSRVLQRADHVMIFLVIAGTATPAFLLSSPGALGLTAFVGLWGLAVGATVIHAVRMDAPEVIVGAVYVTLGLLGGLAVPLLWVHHGTAAATLMLAGGACYLLGALTYHRRRPDPRPSVFGYHELFHAWVCAGATCQYIAIALFVL